MPERQTLERAKRDLKQGKSPSTAAGEFVHEEIEHVRKGQHGARSPQQAIAIGLSKARRAGVPLAPPRKGKTKESTRISAERDYERGQSKQKTPPSSRASSAREEVLRNEPHASASTQSLSRHARSSAVRRSATDRHNAAVKAVNTKGAGGRREAARKAAATRSRQPAE